MILVKRAVLPPAYKKDGVINNRLVGRENRRIHQNTCTVPVRCTVKYAGGGYSRTESQLELHLRVSLDCEDLDIGWCYTSFSLLHCWKWVGEQLMYSPQTLDLCSSTRMDRMDAEPAAP